MAELSGQPSGAARRRRERRLRSMLRHEQQTVRMALAAALHHSAGPKEKVEMQQNGALGGQRTAARAGEEVEYVKHAGLRAQKTPPPGERPGILAEPGPQRSDRTVRRSSGETPLLAVPVLAGGDGVDRTALSFLVRRAVEDRKREEEEKEKEKARKKKEAQEKADLELAKRDPWWAQHFADMKAMEERRNKASSSSKRKRKKRRKMRTPRTSSLPGHARRQPWQWHVQCWFYWSRCTSRYVPFWRRLAQDAPHHGRYGPEGHLQWYGKAGIADDSAPRVVFPSLSSGP